MKCQNCGHDIRIESETIIWVHDNGFATCNAWEKMGMRDATFAEPTP